MLVRLFITAYYDTGILLRFEIKKADIVTSFYQIY